MYTCKIKPRKGRVSFDGKVQKWFLFVLTSVGPMLWRGQLLRYLRWMFCCHAHHNWLFRLFRWSVFMAVMAVMAVMVCFYGLVSLKVFFFDTLGFFSLQLFGSALIFVFSSLFCICPNLCFLPSFLDASSHLYKRVCPCVRPSLRISVTIKEKPRRYASICLSGLVIWIFLNECRKCEERMKNKRERRVKFPLDRLTDRRTWPLEVEELRDRASKN